MDTVAVCERKGIKTEVRFTSANKYLGHVWTDEEVGSAHDQDDMIEVAAIMQGTSL